MRLKNIGLLCSLGLLASMTTQAVTTTLIDPATLEIGARVGENLEVKGDCPNNKSNCLPEEKIKYITAVADRVGQIEFDVNLTDNFELDVNVDWGYPNTEIITLLKVKGNDIGAVSTKFSSSTGGAYFTIFFNGNKRYGDAVGWNNGKFNNIELLAISGVAYLNINGVPFKDSSGDEGDTVNLDTSRPFIKLVITNIQPNDKLYEITLKGGNATTPTTTPPTTTTPTIPTTTTTSSSTSSNNCFAEYNAVTGNLHVPCVLVPIVSGFTNAQIAIYDVQMQQRTGNLTFDLDVNNLKQKGALTPEKQYVSNGQNCTDIRADTYDNTGTTITKTEYITSCK